MHFVRSERSSSSTLQSHIAGSAAIDTDEKTRKLATGVFRILGVSSEAKINKEQFIAGYRSASSAQLFQRAGSIHFQDVREAQIFSRCSTLEIEADHHASYQTRLAEHSNYVAFRLFRRNVSIKFTLTVSSCETSQRHHPCSFIQPIERG